MILRLHLQHVLKTGRKRRLGLRIRVLGDCLVKKLDRLTERVGRGYEVCYS